VRASISQCQSDQAWTNPNSNKYKQCTKWISQSNYLIMENLNHIENVAAHNLDPRVPLDIQIGQSMEGSNPIGSEGIYKALQFIVQTSDSYANKFSCGECLLGIINLLLVYCKTFV
jgi:hypothetical protein